jgi:HD-GYP domain-containing protein (c-di-GMP phosphodiesterase class II)
MTSDRLYREALTYEAAVAEVERCAGSQFDPDVVNAFLAFIGSRVTVSV